MNQLSEISELLKQYPECRVLFDDPIRIKSSPHHHVFTIYGAWEGEGIWLLDGAGDWHGPLLEKQAFAQYVIAGLLQRLKWLSAKNKIA